MKKTEIDVSVLMQCAQAFIDSVQQQLENAGRLDISELEYGLRTALFSDASKILEAFLNQPEVSDLLTSQGTFHEYRTRKVHGLFGVFELQRGYYKTKNGYYCPLDEKLGCVFTSSRFDKDGNPLRDAESTTYVASFNPAAEFTPILLNEANLRGLEKAQRSVVLGDGAIWIWNYADFHFPEALQILDYFHAKEHLTKLSRIIRSNEYRSRNLFEKWSKWLDDNRVLDIVKDARKKICCKGHQRKMGEREIKYLETNSKRMMYGTFKKEGYFIGSGVIEAGCKTVVGKRTKQSGMFWQVKGAQNILNIRCAILGNTYDKFWEYRNSAETARLAS